MEYDSLVIYSKSEDKIKLTKLKKIKGLAFMFCHTYEYNTHCIGTNIMKCRFGWIGKTV